MRRREAENKAKVMCGRGQSPGCHSHHILPVVFPSQVKKTEGEGRQKEAEEGGEGEAEIRGFGDEVRRRAK